MSITDYTMQKYGVSLKHPDLPCVKTSPRRDILIPIQMLDLLNGQRKSKMTQEQTKGMIKTAVVGPAIRMNIAEISIRVAKYNEDYTCQAFGVEVEPKMKHMEARIIDAPFFGVQEQSAGSAGERREIEYDQTQVAKWHWRISLGHYSNRIAHAKGGRGRSKRLSESNGQNR